MTFQALLDGLTFNKINPKDAYNHLVGKDMARKINYFINRDKITTEPMNDAELSQLVSLVNILQILYNSSIDSPVSDRDYDTLQETLVNLGIPRLTGSIEINDSKKVNHNYTQLRGTLSKVYYLSTDERQTNPSRKYLDDWIKSMEAKYKKVTGKEINLNEYTVVCTPKFDGVSVCAEIPKDDGKILWLLRGDTSNNVASDVSHIMNQFNSLFKDYKDYGLKFEVVISEKDLESINKLYAVKPYNSSRHVVASIFNSNELDFKSNYIYPVMLRSIKNGESIESISTDLYDKFPTLRCKLSEREKIREFAIANKYTSPLNDEYMSTKFRTDGVVITILDPDVKAVLGRDNNINNFEVAYKFDEEFGYSTVKDVEFYVSEFSYITPVLVVDTLKLKGNNVSRITLSNKERFDELGLHYGDTVKVLYDVIPYVTIDSKCKVGTGKKINFIRSCPKCGSDLDLDVVEVQCANPECPSRIIGNILNYCSNLRIKNIGYQTLESLYNEGFLKNGIRSLYKLKKYTFDIENLDGFGRVKTKKLVNEIESKRVLLDYEFFGSIGIEGLGIKTFKSIFNVIPYTTFIDFFKSKKYDKLSSLLQTVDGIGGKKDIILISYLSDDDNRQSILKLIKELSIQESFGKSKPKGTIVFTLFRNNELKRLLESKGWEVSNSLTKKTSYLVKPWKNNDSSQSSKIKIAEENNIPIVTIDYIKNNIDKL